jgi:GNAT superfamily N-acetyltransferase
VIVRAAKPEDAYGISVVRTETWRATYRGILPDGYLDSLRAEDRAEQMRQAIADEGREEYFYVAEDEGRIVGFAICGPERDGIEEYRGEVYAIYVLPAYQRRGIGHKLMQAAASKLSTLGISSMLLWTPDKNAYGKFYEKAGGVRVARKTHEIGGTPVMLVAYGWKTLPK